MKDDDTASPKPQCLEGFMPTVTILQGARSLQLKRELVRGITDAFVDTLGVPAESVQIWIQETPADSWGQGGALTADKK
jgi:4-oxalocrotonate tautomerase